MGLMQVWTEEMIATIKKLWVEDDWSATTIAAHINKTYGVSVTRSSVIGKAHRVLGAKAKNVKAVGSGHLISSPKPHSPLMRAKPRPPLHPLPPDDQLIGVTLMDLEDSCCRWICASADEPIYCGRRKDQTRSTPYCPAHAERARADPRPYRRVRWDVKVERAFRPG
jgi:hypothetical protein